MKVEALTLDDDMVLYSTKTMRDVFTAKVRPLSRSADRGRHVNGGGGERPGGGADSPREKSGDSRGHCGDLRGGLMGFIGGESCEMLGMRVKFDHSMRVFVYWVRFAKRRLLRGRRLSRRPAHFVPPTSLANRSTPKRSNHTQKGQIKSKKVIFLT